MKMKPKEFVAKYKWFALQNEKNTGVPYLLTLAQAALESAWGEKALGNNFFGIKAGKTWKGEVVEFNTHEVESGKSIALKDQFRKYPTPQECFEDHANILKNRFPKAFRFTDPVDFIASVQNEHGYKYATDPDYVTKIASIINTLKKNLQ
jgi:flagellar protein FlgJ